ncbi:hypothetical protein ABPG74_006677 [Tetrahymena malaccensis]
MDKTTVPQDLNENQKKEFLYLSFEEIENQTDQGQEENNSSEKFSYFDYTILFIKSIFEIIILFFIGLPLMVILLPCLFMREDVKFTLKKLFLLVFLVISLASINYTVINFIIAKENMLFTVEQILKDTIFFIVTTLIVATFLKTNIQKQSMSFQESFFQKLTDTFLYNFGVVKQEGYYLDYQIKKFNSDKLSAPSKYFKLFGSTEKKYIDELLQNFDQHLTSNFLMFGLLTSVVILKLFMVFYYLYIHSQMEISKKNIVDLTFSIFTYIYAAFLLCRILGNFDLIRKIDQFKQLNDYINFSQEDLFKESKFKNKLDILSAGSLETWDSSRKLLLTHEYEELITLELAYLGLVFYYLFVIIICLCAFYELDWIIPKDSPLLSDTVIIMSFFNFVFLSLFFMYRFQKGTEFNQCFDDLQLTIQELLDVVSDLGTQYNDYFLQDREQENKVQKNSIYGLVIIKIKQMSYEYINNKKQYLGKYYTLEQKEDLRIKIIGNTKACLKKLSQSIKTDQQKYSYKFLNLFDIQFNEFLTSVLIVTITSLPQIIPKFIGFYKL